MLFGEAIVFLFLAGENGRIAQDERVRQVQPSIGRGWLDSSRAVRASSDYALTIETESSRPNWTVMGD